MTGQRSVALLGGQESGKSTYLGALIEALERNECPGLRPGRLGANIRDLQRLSDPLLDGDYPQRTKEDRLHLRLSLETAQDGLRGGAFHLDIGDYDGEEVERLFTHRTQGWSPDWEARASSDGVLLFLRPDAVAPLPQLTPPQSGQNTSLLLRSPTPDEEFGPQSIAPEAGRPRRRASTEPVRVPTALAIIELLQFIRHVRGWSPGERPRNFRVGILVTAWDAVSTPTPREYLAEHLHLLEDYLWSNFEAESIHRFGLSSTGGDLKDAEYRTRYLDRQHPLAHVVWSGLRGTQLHRSSDLSIPILWALFGDGALRAE